MKAVAFSGSPRVKSNSAALLDSFSCGVREAGGSIETIDTQKCAIRPCRGCLRCNLVKRCTLRGDDWQLLSAKILSADILVFASPVYFHHVTAPLKILLDRFRSFMQVRITEQGLEHIPWNIWEKRFVLLLTMGSSATEDAQPVIELFRFITQVLGTGNSLHYVTATRLALAGQIHMNLDELQNTYAKLQLPLTLAETDCARNQSLLSESFELGKKSVIY